MINSNQPTNKLVTELAEVFMIRNQIFAYVCGLLLVVAWSDTYRLLVQLYSILMIASLSHSRISLNNSSIRPISKQRTGFNVLLCVGTGLIIGSAFRYLIPTPFETQSLVEVQTAVLLMISGCSFSYIHRLTKSGCFDRGVVWSAYINLSLFFAIVGSFLLYLRSYQ